MNSLPRAVAATVLALGSTFAVAACGSDEPTEKAVEKAIEDSAGEDVDVDLDDGKVKVETDEGTVTTGKGLPEGFPDDVPVADGNVLNGVDSPQGYLATIEYDGSAAEASDDAKGLLEDAGFKSEGEMPVGAVFKNSEWQVLVLAQEAGGKTLLSYTVSPAE